MDMLPPYISNNLIHWTGRGKTEEEAFEIVKIIIDTNRLLLSSCPTTGKQDEITAKEQIVCFTDIPVELSSRHCSRFGQFGVAFDKSVFIEYGANPVLYYTKQFEQLIQNIYQKRLRGIDEASFDLPLHEMLSKLSSLFQSYSYKIDEDEELNYYQREWRLAFNSNKVANHFKGENSQGLFTLGAPGNKSYFNFYKKDVRFIIISKSFEDLATQFLKDKHSNIELKLFEKCVNR